VRLDLIITSFFFYFFFSHPFAGLGIIDQVYIPIGFSGFFPHAMYNLTADIEQCRQKFGITLRPNWYATIDGVGGSRPGLGLTCVTFHPNDGQGPNPIRRIQHHLVEQHHLLQRAVGYGPSYLGHRLLFFRKERALS
jgi:hypothetical protein